MNATGTNLTLDLFAHKSIDLMLALAVVSLICVPWATAGENKHSPARTSQAQPTIRASASPETKSSLEQALTTQFPKSSVDFLMERSPGLSEDQANATPQMLSAPAPVQQVSPVTLEVLQGKVVEEAEEVAMLVSEQCSQSGSTAESTNKCDRIYSNGHHATVMTQSSNEGDEAKRQTVIEEFDAGNTLLFKKTIRHRVDYNYLNDQKAKEKEFFDIIYQPVNKKTTRELMVYEYFLDTGKTRSLSWTQYKQIGSQPKAELVYNALLRYGADGSPDRGIAEQWNHGEKTETFLNWSRQSKDYATLDPEAWQQWEGWIRNVSLQAYLP